MQTQRTALVIGANGGIGHETCLALLRHGWRVRALVRKAPTIEQGGIDWRTGDAMSRADVVEAAAGVDVIVHAVNPPGYRAWNRLVLPMMDNTIAAARAPCPGSARRAATGIRPGRQPAPGRLSGISLDNSAGSLRSQQDLSFIITSAAWPTC